MFHANMESLKRLPADEFDELAANVAEESKRRKLIDAENKKKKETELLEKCKSEDTESIILDIIRKHSIVNRSKYFLDSRPDFFTTDYVGILEMDFWSLVLDDKDTATVKRDYYLKILQELLSKNKIYAYYTSIYGSYVERGKKHLARIPFYGVRTLALSCEGELPPFKKYVNAFTYGYAVYDEKNNFWVDYETKTIQKSVPDDKPWRIQMKEKEDFTSMEKFSFDDSD